MTEKLVETAKATIDSAGREAERARLEIRYSSIWRVLMLLTMRERCKCSSEWSVDGMCVTTSTPTPRLKLRDKQEHASRLAVWPRTVPASVHEALQRHRHVTKATLEGIQTWMRTARRMKSAKHDAHL